MNITKKLSPTQLSPTHIKNPSGNRNAMPGSASCETPETDAITNNPNTSALHKGARLAHHARNLERERDAWKLCAKNLAWSLRGIAWLDAYDKPSPAEKAIAEFDALISYENDQNVAPAPEQP